MPMNAVEADEDLEQVTEAMRAASKSMADMVHDEGGDKDPEMLRMLCQQATDGLAACTVLFVQLAQDVQEDDSLPEAAHKEMEVRKQKVNNAISQLKRIISATRQDLGVDESVSTDDDPDIGGEGENDVEPDVDP